MPLQPKTHVSLGSDQIALVDVVTGAWRGLLPSDDSYRSVSLSQDAGTLLIETESVDGDIWLLESPAVQK